MRTRNIFIIKLLIFLLNSDSNVQNLLNIGYVSNETNTDVRIYT